MGRGQVRGGRARREGETQGGAVLHPQAPQHRAHLRDFLRRRGGWLEEMGQARIMTSEHLKIWPVRLPGIRNCVVVCVDTNCRFLRTSLRFLRCFSLFQNCSFRKARAILKVLRFDQLNSRNSELCGWLTWFCLHQYELPVLKNQFTVLMIF